MGLLSDRPHRDKLISFYTDRLWTLDVKPHRIYVAASLAAQGDAAKLALQLKDAGFIVTSRWIRADFSHMINPNEAWAAHKAQQEQWGALDLNDLSDADTLVILANVPSSSGGFHAELGYFLGAGRKNIIAVGERPNVFFWTEDVRWKCSVNGLVEWLQSPEHGCYQPIPVPELPPLESMAMHATTRPTGEDMV